MNRKVGVDEFNKWLRALIKQDHFTRIVHNCKNEPGLFKDIIIEDVMYLRTNYFSMQSSQEIFMAIKDCNQKFLIIDLRNNAGGSVEAMVEIADLLLGKCEICALHLLNSKKVYYSDEKYKQFDKIFLMTNNKTMSSAEILAMTLVMNLDNTYVVGTETYKKSVGQISIKDKRGRFIFSFTAFKWKVKDKTIFDFFGNIKNQNRMISVSEDADYNDYIKKIVDNIQEGL